MTNRIKRVFSHHSYLVKVSELSFCKTAPHFWSGKGLGKVRELSIKIKKTREIICNEDKDNWQTGEKKSVFSL